MQTYNIGGQLFYKQGGYLRPVKNLPKALDGEDLTDNPFAFKSVNTGYLQDDKAISAAIGQGGTSNKPGFGYKAKEWAQGFVHSPQAILTSSSAIGNMLGALNKDEQPYSEGQYASNMMKPYQNTKEGQVAGKLLDTASQLDPTGVTAIVNAGVKVGQGLSKVIDHKNKYGYSDDGGGKTALAGLLDPLGNMQDSINVGRKHGFGAGMKNFFSFGTSGNELKKQDVFKGLDRDKQLDMSMRQGLNKGNYLNNSVFAKEGAVLQPKDSNTEQEYKQQVQPNVEIEDGEIFIGDPTKLTYFGDNVKTSHESKYAAKFNGDKHGQDTNKDGMEGIPLNSDGGYIASNYLGVNGKRATGRNKSVAKEMEPLVKALANAEKKSNDKYINNPVAIKHYLDTIEEIKNEAEKNKANQESKQTKLNSNLNSNTMNPYQNGGTIKLPYNASKPFLKKFQAGGEVNASSDRMQQLAQQAPQMNQQQAPQQQRPDPQQLQQMFAQLPPEIQQQIQALPPEQQAQAIMEYAQQMQASQQPTVDPLAEGQEQMQEAPMQQAPMQNGGHIQVGKKMMFKCGGKIMQGTVKNVNHKTGYFEMD